MQPHKFIIGVLLFSVFVFGGIFIMYGTIANVDDGLLHNYDVPKDSLASKLENLTATETVAESVQNVTGLQRDDTREEVDTSTQWRVIDIGPVKAIRRMYTFFTSVNVLIQQIALLMHIPVFFVDTAMVIIMVMVVFIVIYFIMRFQLRND